MISNDIKYVGVNDKKIDLFEGQFKVPNGMAYNSYVIMDEKIAVFDSVDALFLNEWLNNIETALNGKKPDYFVVSHMEPDHSANIYEFLAKYPDAVVIASQKAFKMMEQFFGSAFETRRIVATEGLTLCLGKHNLTFYTAPMVHWPEVIVTYDSTDKVLFSADAFGKFGALDTDEDWACEARRYYFGIVGKYGAQASALLKKAEGLDIEAICPLHGPVLSENLGYYINLYKIWSSYAVEDEGVTIAYTSVYGNTKKAAKLLYEQLLNDGVKNIEIFDLARDDVSEAVESAFRYSNLVLATTTYNADIFPHMRSFIEGLTERNYQNRSISFIENGSWAPTAVKTMKKLFENSKNITFVEPVITINSSMSEQNKNDIASLSLQLVK